MQTFATMLAAFAIVIFGSETAVAASSSDPVARWFASGRCAAFDGGWTGNPPVVKRDSQGVIFDSITANTRGYFYDPKTRRALYYPNRDSEGVFLLRMGGPPPVGVVRHDLSKLHTASGITLGTASGNVVRLLGKPAIVRKCGLQRYVYLESAQGEPQTLQFTIDGGRVTEIFEDFPG
jgi:hypothetical protein